MDDIQIDEDDCGARLANDFDEVSFTFAKRFFVNCYA